MAKSKKKIHETQQKLSTENLQEKQRIHNIQ